jgi:hypothetical protein
VPRQEPGGGTIRAWRGMGDYRVASPILYEGRRRLALRHRSGAIGYPRSGGTAPLPSAPLPRLRLRRRRCRSGRLARSAACPTKTRLANIRGPSSEESGTPHRFRFASYANPSEFRTSEISQRGSPPSATPVAYRCSPPSHSRTLSPDYSRSRVSLMNKGNVILSGRSQCAGF